jgi:transcriptional regulator with XRE-family HTH domain
MIEKVSNFKTRFNQALELRNMKPVELSEKTGISESTISQYRSGYAKPKEDKLAIISNALNVNPVWLLGLNVPIETKPMPDTDNIDVKNEIITQYENLSPEKKAEFRNFLKFLQSDI